MTEEETTTTEEKPLVEQEGAFFESLARNAKQIRRDRAEAMAEDGEMHFRRAVEDLQTKLKRLKRTRENMLDMSPDSTIGLKLKDFDADEFVQEDLKLGKDIHNLSIELDIAKSRYKHLFGKEL